MRVLWISLFVVLLSLPFPARGETRIEPKYWIQIVPNDPLITGQWGLTNIHAQQAWNLTGGSDEILVAVLDSGIDVTNPEFAGRVITGPSFVDESASVDVLGHGTHVAGIIAANANDNLGIAGIAFRTRILAVKVLGDDGSGLPSDIAIAIDYARMSGARVINLSLGGEDPSPQLERAINRALAAGIVVVAAAGNRGTTGNPLMYPAAYPGVISVGALNQDGSGAVYSGTGSWVSVFAPGTGIYSTWINQQYASVSGTSMAAPHVSAVIALMLAVQPGITVAEIRYILGQSPTLRADDAVFQAARLQPRVDQLIRAPLLGGFR